ncbi:MAG: hypothetical protein ACRELB_08895, partial [Polyangiaceae bacterium]
MAGASFDMDLPVRAQDLPSPRRGDDGIGLPVVAADLPAPAASLPAVAAGLPSPAASLPVPAASLPVPAANLPSVAASLPMPAAALPVSRSFGEIDLPEAAEILPSHASPLPPAPGGGAFGEIDLPGERPAPPVKDSADFGDLTLEERPRSVRPPRSNEGSRDDSVGPVEPGDALAFGEVDFGGGADRAVRVETDGPSRGDAGAMGSMRAAATAPVSVRAPPMQPRAQVRVGETGGRKYGKLVAGGLVLAAVAAGASLQLTSYGAFGYLAIGDRLHASEYVATTSATITRAEKTLGADTYDAARSAIDIAGAAHAHNPRIKALAAYAAIVDAETTARFGQDLARTPRAKQWLAELPPGEPVKYEDVAFAAQAAADGDLDKARKALDAASKRYPNDPIQIDVSLLRGGLELAAKDAPAAVVAYKHAIELSGDARGHFGLARAYDRLGDLAGARKELDATLAASPLHAGALTLRARMSGASADDSALRDLAKVIEGPGRAKASPAELSRAYAAKAWILLGRGAASEARDAFAQAVKLDARNVDALTWEGHLLMSEGRFT